MHYLSNTILRPAVAALALATVAVVAVHAEDAKPAANAPADPALANSLNPNDKEKDEKLLARDAAVKVDDGKYLDSLGHPTFRVTNEGKKVDWYLYSGYRRYHAECHVCHGPDAMGSTYAPALKDSLKRLSYEEFIGILAGGKRDTEAGQEKVMPAFGDNKNVMCYADDLYVYLKARAAGAWGRARPGEKEEKPEAVKTTEKECLGG
ncbi:c-type cytochrome, methanol metabolism-related [Methylobacterium durans]|uniref:c-type cytochrome, methanol metabolism-related n=1 Tax=Methylobacterium durans TaxID=2202825 RepID=UPI002AFF2CA9|nr:c-type cytochrome, methanol metabolism-related [Methylobacterium durans]MEA1833807.1 c-type cytochrome, methanol metabolism-related [Methylobacterium durans]